MLIANPVVGESALPDFAFAAKDFTQRVRVCALDELNGVFDRHVVCGSEQKMNVLGHNDERMKFISCFASIAVESL